MAKKKNTRKTSSNIKSTQQKEKTVSETKTTNIKEVVKDIPEVTPALAFQKENYFIMLGGLFLLALGLWIMSIDKETFGFGFMGLTLGPIIVFLGFMVQFAAIFYKKKQKSE